MIDIAELRGLPPIQKLRILEALWDDLAADDGQYQSPSWHAAELQETAEAYAAGRIETVDWSAAKDDLRKQFR
jgi:putative addiction module component (TIGR02574 family)